MKTNEIYTAYVSWGEDGKRRPVLIVNDEKRNIYYVQEGKFVILSYCNKKIV